MDYTKPLHFIRKYLAFVVIVLFACSLVYFVATHGFLTIDMSGQEGETTTVITNQNTNTSTTIKSTNTKIKRLMPTGKYEVVVGTLKKNSWGLTNVGRFLSTNTANVALKPQSNREIVGYNPEACMNYVGDTFSSFACGGSLDAAKMQVPPTTKSPSYVSTIFKNSRLQVTNIVETKSGLVGLVTSTDAEIDGGQQYFLAMTPKLGIINKMPVSGTVKDVLAFRDGFLTYDSAYSGLTYYSSVGGAAEKINLEVPKDKDLKPYLFKANGSDFVIAYSNKSSANITGNEASAGSVKSAVLIYQAGKAKMYTTNKLFADVQLCGNKKLCALQLVGNKNKQLFVYDTSAGSLDKSFVMNNVQAIKRLDTGLVAVSNTDILLVDVEKQQGIREFTFGEYGFCGVQGFGSSYLLCATDKGYQKNTVFSINSTQDTTVPVDELALEIEGNAVIKSLSIYRQNIYILPNFGEPVYDTALKSYTYDKIQKAYVLDTLQKALAKYDLEARGYTVTIVGK